ncbi:pilus assembly FimT family protein [Alkalithermobacter thermoalcaliphilus]
MYIGILSIVLAIPLFKVQIRNYQIDSFIRQLAHDIRYVRVKNMNSDYSTYIYYKDYEDNVKSYVLREKGQDKKEVKLPKNTIISHSVKQIKFSLSGALTQQGETIVITDKVTNKKRELTIVPFSGRVLIKEDIYDKE